MTIDWTDIAKETYADELEFIDVKWGIKEVENFMILSDDFLKTLATGTFEGKPIRKGSLRTSVISKQTSIYYKIDETSNSIILVCFWNNKKDPNALRRILANFKNRKGKQ